MSNKKLTIFAVFLLSLVYFCSLCAPDVTWVNTDSDGITYLTAARDHTLTHPTGAPLFNLINWVVVKIPLGSEFWRLAMVSALCSVATTVLLYLIASRYIKGWKALIAPAVFMASGLVVSQSTIVETYAMASLIMVGTYYLHLLKRNRWKYVLGGLGVAIHPLTLLTTLPMLVSDWWNSGKDLKMTARYVATIFVVGLPFYLYIPLMNTGPFLWIRGTDLINYVDYFTRNSPMAGGLAVFPADDLVERLGEFSLIILGGFAISLILIIPGMVNMFRSRECLLPIVFLFPLVYYLVNVSPQTYVYCMPAFAFGGIIAARFLAEHKVKELIPKAVLASCIVLMLLNCMIYDIGNNLDKELKAASFYDDLDTLEPDAVVWCQWRGWEKIYINLYNVDNGTNIAAPRFIMGDCGYSDYEGLKKLCRDACDEGRMYITSIRYDTDEIDDPVNKGVNFTLISESELGWIMENDDHWDRMAGSMEGYGED